MTFSRKLYFHFLSKIYRVEILSPGQQNVVNLGTKIMQSQSCSMLFYFAAVVLHCIFGRNFNYRNLASIDFISIPEKLNLSK